MDLKNLTSQEKPAADYFLEWLREHNIKLKKCGNDYMLPGFGVFVSGDRWYSTDMTTGGDIVSFMSNILEMDDSEIGFEISQMSSSDDPLDDDEIQFSAGNPVSMICLQDVEQIPVEWLWHPYIPFGKLTTMLGNPGEGKTFLATEIIAACTNRKLLPGMNEPLEPFNVIYQTAEDGLGDTIKPRLLAAGADLSRVFSIDDTDSMISLLDERVERAIEQNHVRLCIFDPLQAFMGASVDMNRANEVRPIFARLCNVAQRTGCAMVFIGHLNKAVGMSSLQRGLGSIDIVASMRSVLLVCKAKEDPDLRVVAHEKSSLAPNGPSIAFRLDMDHGLQWCGLYEVSGDELLAGAPPKREKKSDTAAALVNQMLTKANGNPLRREDFINAANQAGISTRTMDDALAKLPDHCKGRDGHAAVFRLPQ